MKEKAFKIVPTETSHAYLDDKKVYQLHKIPQQKGFSYKVTDGSEFKGVATMVNDFNEYIHVLKLSDGKNKIEIYRFYFIEDEDKIFKKCVKTSLPNKVHIGPRGGMYILKKERKVYV